MSKKRDALRRGIRDLLQDTSRDLVAFEGREPGPHAGRVRDVPAPGHPETDAAEAETTKAEVRHGDTPADTYAAELSLNGGPVQAIIDRPEPRADLPPDTPPVIMKLERADPAAPPAPDPDRDAVPGAEAGPSGAAASHEAPPAPAPFELTAGTAFLPPVTPSRGPAADRAGEISTARRSASRPAPSKKSKPARRSATRQEAAKRPEVPGPAARAKDAQTGKGRAPAAKPARPAAPAADDIEAEGVSPTQVQSRTGVCRSYFINHECWRVSNAYCNTALQVCVIRNCPVYHLHKDALERRFANKFKHFW